MASFGKRGRRFLAGAVFGAVLALAFPFGACTPVMTTRYREVPLGGWESARGETVRFELSDGSNVDLRDGRRGLRLNAENQTVSGQTPSGSPAQIDLRDVRRVGVAFEQKDEPATKIKYWAMGSVGYVGFLVGVAILVSLSGQ